MGEDIRILKAYDGDKYLIPFPHKFNMKKHQIILERGRYPTFTEVFLMVCMINSDNTTSQFLPLIVDKTKSVKFVKQRILELFNKHPNEYKKYVCYDVTQGTHKK